MIELAQKQTNAKTARWLSGALQILASFGAPQSFLRMQSHELFSIDRSAGAACLFDCPADCIYCYSHGQLVFERHSALCKQETLQRPVMLSDPEPMWSRLSHECPNLPAMSIVFDAVLGALASKHARTRSACPRHRPHPSAGRPSVENQSQVCAHNTWTAILG